MKQKKHFSTKKPIKKILKNHNKLPTRNKRTDKSKKNKEISSDA